MKGVDTEGFPTITPPASLGPAPQLQWLPIDELVIDLSYQRETTSASRKNIRHIAERFNWAFFTPVIVSPIEGGRYAIIDGQHRTTAAKLIGIKSVPCALMIADRATQAEAFSAINAQTTKLLPCQIFHARLAAFDQRAIAMKAVCDAAGVRIPKYSGGWQAKPENTLALKVIEEWSERDPAALRVALICIRVANEHRCHDRNHLHTQMVRAVAEVLHDHPEWLAEERRLRTIFGTLDLDQLWAGATIANAQIKGTSVGDQLQAALIDEFEKRFERVAA